MTYAFKRRRRRSFGSLEALRIRLRWAYLDQAIAIRWLTATSGSPSLDCITPRYLKCRTFDSPASTSLTFSSPSCSAFFFASFTSLSAADQACDGSHLDDFDRRPQCSSFSIRISCGSSSVYSTKTCILCLPLIFRTVSRRQSNRSLSFHFRTARIEPSVGHREGIVPHCSSVSCKGSGGSPSKYLTEIRIFFQPLILRTAARCQSNLLVSSHFLIGSSEPTSEILVSSVKGGAS